MTLAYPMDARKTLTLYQNNKRPDKIDALSGLLVSLVLWLGDVKPVYIHSHINNINRRDIEADLPIPETVY